MNELEIGILAYANSARARREYERETGFKFQSAAQWRLFIDSNVFGLGRLPRSTKHAAKKARR